MYLRRSDLDIYILSFTWKSTSSGLSHGDLIYLYVSFDTLFAILDKEKNERYILTFSSLLYIIRLWKDGIILGYPDRNW